MSRNAARAPYIKVQTPDLPPRTHVHALVAHLAEGTHPVTELTMLHALPRNETLLRRALPTPAMLTEGTPVHLTWGMSAGASADFYGYVASRQVLGDPTGPRLADATVVPVRYTLIGVSWLMQNQTSRAWQNASADYIARQVIAGYTLQAVVQNHPRAYPYKTQANVSDFAFLGQLAADTGYRLIVDKAAVYLTDPSVPLGPTGAAVPAFGFSRTPGVADSVWDFRVTTGTTDPTGATHLTRTINTLNPATRQIVQTNLQPQGQQSAVSVRSATATTARSAAEAAFILSGEQRANQLWVAAECCLDGNPAIQPGRLVTLSGQGLADPHSGLWRVTATQHKVTLHASNSRLGVYYCQTTLGRDNDSSLTLATQRVDTRLAPAVVLAGGRWTSAYTGATYDQLFIPAAG
jgi:uncharacterized protein involved in type VI secretion and phage assembly